MSTDVSADQKIKKLRCKDGVAAVVGNVKLLEEFTALPKLKVNKEGEIVADFISTDAFGALLECSSRLKEHGGDTNSAEFEAFFVPFSAKHRTLLFELLLGADKLGHRKLRVKFAQHIGEYLASTSADKARKELGLVDDLTELDRERILRESEWCIEK